jgi:hypothetical protein
MVGKDVLPVTVVGRFGGYRRVGRGRAVEGRPGVRGRRVLAAAVAAVLAGTALVGCSSRSGGSGSADVDPPELNALVEPEKVPVLLTEHLGYSPFVRSVNLYDSGFSAVVRDRAKPENLDTYYFRNGEWTSDPVSVSLSDIERFEKVTFPLSAVRWDLIPSLQQQALDGLDLEGEEITSVGLDKLEGDPPRIYIGVQGLRGNGRLIANADGTNVDIQRN